MSALTRDLRALAAYRLSRDTDESTSIERQRDQLGHWSAMTGIAIVADAEDTDVSGSVPVFDRPDLGRYFRAP
ncbi:MAG TPA: recombinase family protein, partial [Trebonia sp.]|nr:recombinase family protein [Trebonia sp.]